MGIVKELVGKTKVGGEDGIVPAGSSPQELEIFKTVLGEAHRLRDAGEIEIVVEAPDRVRFKRLK